MPSAIGALPKDGVEGVAFEVPRALRSRRVAGVIAASVLVPFLVAVGLLIGVGGFALNGKLPWWLIVSMIVAAGMCVPVVLRLGRRDLQQGIDLADDAIVLRSWRWNERIPYERVRLVDKTMLDEAVNGVCRVSIGLVPRGRRTMDLSKEDADECFDALRSLCERAAAVDAHGKVSLPHDKAFSKQRSQEIARSLWWRSMILMAISLAASGIAVVAVVALVTDPATRARPKAWVVALTLPVFAILFVVSALAMLKESHRVLSQAR